MINSYTCAGNFKKLDRKMPFNTINRLCKKKQLQRQMDFQF